MKALNELTLLDKFLFDEVMDIPEAHEAALSGWMCTPLIKICESTTPKLRKQKSLICHVEVASIRVLWTRGGSYQRTDHKPNFHHTLSIFYQTNDTSTDF